MYPASVCVVRSEERAVRGAEEGTRDVDQVGQAHGDTDQASPGLRDVPGLRDSETAVSTSRNVIHGTC